MVRQGPAILAVFIAGAAVLLGRLWAGPRPSYVGEVPGTVEEDSAEDESDAELAASLQPLVAGPELNISQGAVLTFMPCGFLGNTLFQLSALLSIAADSGGKLKVAIPDLLDPGVIQRVLAGAGSEAAERVFSTVLRRVRPLLVKPQRLLKSWPDWVAVGKCAQCSLGELRWRQRRCLARGVRTCQVDVESAAKYGTCMDEIRDIEDATDLPSELLREALGMANGPQGDQQQETGGAAGGCRVIWVTGYFQDYRYSSARLAWLQRLFWHAPTAREAAGRLRELAPEDATLISLHYRLGNFKPLGRVLDDEFYVAALAEARRRLGRDLTCLVFSDEPQEAFQRSKGLQLCSRRVAVPTKLHDTTRFHMMALVPHAVLSASTFAYWAARLGPQKSLVIAPKLQHSWFSFIGEPPGNVPWLAMPANFSGGGPIG